MKIILDVFGCDNSPSVILDGVVAAMKENADLSPVLSGNESIIRPILLQKGADLSRIEILDAKEVITNDDSATLAVKQKKDSSLIVAIDALKNREDIVGMVSAGSTGAVLTAGVLKLGRLDGIMRPALAPLLPTRKGGRVCLVDCGANVDCKPEYLVQFAHMGAAYVQANLGVKNPKVALVSVGVEDKKGNELTKAAFALLKDSTLNFVGNMEARDALCGDFDVLVCDGFVGNVLLKSIEGTAVMVMSKLKTNIKASGWAKFGSIFMKKAFKNLKNDMDYHSAGGAPLLGVKKVLIKGHGSSDSLAIKAAMLQAHRLAGGQLIEKISTIAQG